MKETRRARKEAIGQLGKCGQGALDAFADLIACELAEGAELMETAGDITEIWRLQGRIRALRQLQSVITNNAG